SDAPNRDNAYAFMNYMMDPEAAAGCTNYTYYANANIPAREFVLQEILDDPAVYPDAETIGRMWAPKPFSEEQDRAITRAWQQIKSG
ncbi:MAG: spermidine/putrescine ABC transporter substrate-binding protein PotF, partial [Albidovulum sp.]